MTLIIVKNGKKKKTVKCKTPFKIEEPFFIKVALFLPWKSTDSKRFYETSNLKDTYSSLNSGRLISRDYYLNSKVLS